MANRPIHEIRLGKVKAAIWRNETDSPHPGRQRAVNR